MLSGWALPVVYLTESFGISGEVAALGWVSALPMRRIIHVNNESTVSNLHI